MSNKLGVDLTETLLKNIFNNDIGAKEIQRRKCIKSLEEVIIDPKGLDIFTTGFENRTRQLGQSHFTYYTRDIVSVLKKQFNLVDNNQLSTSPEYECTKPNDVHSGLGRQIYPVAEDVIEMQKSADIRW